MSLVCPSFLRCATVFRAELKRKVRTELVTWKRDKSCCIRWDKKNRKALISMLVLPNQIFYSLSFVA